LKRRRVFVAAIPKFSGFCPVVDVSMDGVVEEVVEEEEEEEGRNWRRAARSSCRCRC
jgi:hypothetical protein